MREERYTICACSSRTFIPKSRIVELVARLRCQGLSVRLVADLCRLIERDDESLSAIAASTIIACYPRAIEALFASRGLTPARVMDMRSFEWDAILRDLGLEAIPDEALFLAEKARAEAEFNAQPIEVGHDAWFPVIDRSRCVDCGQCHDFCLFGVYAREAGQVRVVAPDRCKNNCPACARVCPERAIIFPKYSKSPINGGLEDEENLSGLDAKSLYAEALRTRLRQRRASVSLLGGQPEKEGGARDE